MDALEALLGADLKIEQEVFIKRLNTHFTVKAINGQLVNRLRDEAIHYVGKGSKREAQFNEDEFSSSLIVAGCITPDFSNAKLLEKYGARDAGDCVLKAMLAGEIKALQEAILRLSGYVDNADEEVEEVKN